MLLTKFTQSWKNQNLKILNYQILAIDLKSRFYLKFVIDF